ncbi:MAG: RNB domain-containing ribonuclease [Bacilli bacterium]|nr:RNB domain-containing ribonuclease [Bacilli bacterium]
MGNSLFFRIIEDICNHNYSLDEMIAKFYVEDSEQLINYVLDVFESNIEEFLTINSFRSNYHTFLYYLTDAINNPNVLFSLSIKIKHVIRKIEELLKPYNKGLKDKDEKFNKLNRLKRDLNTNLTNNEQKIYRIYENDNFKVLKHIIFDIKDIDVLYHIINTHKGIVNLSNNDEYILETVIRHLLLKINDMEDDEIDYYRRVITMFFKADKLDIAPDRLEELKNDIEFQIKRNPENTNLYDYLLYLINYQLNDLRMFNQKKFIVPSKLSDGRVDYRYLPTITIDMSSKTKMLYDDAFSIEELEDGSVYLYLHVPDVDEYVQENSDLEDYMRHMGMSRYVANDRRPMIPYDLSRKMSLNAGNDVASLTYRVHLNDKGIVLGLDFMKSVIHVDDNLTRYNANNLFTTGKYKYMDVLEKMASLARRLRMKRNRRVGKKSNSAMIMEEFNIWGNIFIASYFNENGIVFPYKNLVHRDYNSMFINDISTFLKQNELETEAKSILFDICDAESRQFYSTENQGNANFGGRPYGSVGNPLREYMSLETTRLIKSLLIDVNSMQEDWEERLINDCAEQTEIQAKVKELYKTTK